MNRTHFYNNYEFDIVKRDDVVTITCLDKLLHKSYRDSFTRQFVNETISVNNLNNFFEIINHSFDNKCIIVSTNNDSIELNINYSNGLTFDFSLLLALVEQTQLNANSLYIKKLEEKIAFLEENCVVQIGTQTNYAMPILVPLYLNELEIITNNTDLQIPNKQNNYKIYSYSYNYDTNKLTINVTNNSSSTYNYLNTMFSKLKPRRIIISDHIKSRLTKDDLNYFPKEHNYI